jgi:hypothetical protein
VRHNLVPGPFLRRKLLKTGEVAAAKENAWKKADCGLSIPMDVKTILHTGL